MSRTYVHKPLWLLPDLSFYDKKYHRYYNTKGTKWARDDRRRIRHVKAGDDVGFVSAIRRYKQDIYAVRYDW